MWVDRAALSGRGVSPEAIARQLGQLKAMWFPSPEHLSERIDQLIAFTQGVVGQSQKTRSWLTCSLRSFRNYLKASGREDAFLRGELVDQARVIDCWVAWLRATGRSHTTVHTYWRALESAFNRIGRQDGTASPLQWCEKPRPGLLRPRALPRGAIETIFSFLRNQQWCSPFERARALAVVGCMALAGLRKGEVLKLAVGDVQLETGTLRIRQGKGRDGGRDRTAYMTPQLSGLVSEYLAERKRLERTHDELFSSVYRNTRISDAMIYGLFRQIEAGTEIHATPHMLRHSYATLLRQVGVSDRVAMDLLGHRSLSVLQRYSAVFAGECADEVKRLSLNVPLS